MKKRWFILGALVFFAIFVIADVGDLYRWHTSDIILVEIDGFNITLQDAINNNYFGSVHPTADSNYPFYSHLASEILVTSPNGYTMTLQEMSDTDSFVAGVADGTLDVGGGHLADDIRAYSKAGNVMSLQDLIDSKIMFCKVCADYYGGATCGSYLNECGETVECGTCGTGDYCFDGDCSPVTWSKGSWSTASSCGDTVTRTVNCVDGSGTVIANSICYESLGSNSRPATTGTTSCVWAKGSYLYCSELSSIIECEVREANGGVACYCGTVVGSACSDSSATSTCLDEVEKSCGSICDCHDTYDISCSGIVYPAS